MAPILAAAACDSSTTIAATSDSSTQAGAGATANSGTGGGTGSGGAGGAAACVPGTIEPCYSGPNGTAGIGACQPGTQECNADGTGFGACIGEVLPIEEDCATATDDNCLGGEPDCGSHLWSRRFGDAEDQQVADIAVDAGGASLVVGSFLGTVTFGGDLLAAVDTDIFIASLDASGEHAWSKRFGGSGIQGAEAAAFDPSNDAYVTGAFTESVDFGGGVLASIPGVADVFVAKLDSSGNHLWSKQLGGSSPDYPADLAVDGSSGVIVTGVYAGSSSFGGGPMASAGGTDVFIVKLDAAGDHQWSIGFGGPSDDYAYAVATSSDGDIVVAGHAGGGSIDFGGGPVVTAFGDKFVAKYDGAGNSVWARVFGGTGALGIQDVDIDASGTILLGGVASADFELEGTSHSAGAFVARLDPSGAPVFSETYGSYDLNWPTGVTAIKAGAAGSFFIAGTFYQSIEFGGAPLTDVHPAWFLAKLDPGVDELWSIAFVKGDNIAGFPAAIDLDSSGRPHVAGQLYGDIDFGGEKLTSEGGADITIAKLSN